MGDTRNELLGGKRNNGGYEERAKGPEWADASLCVVTITRGGVVKSFAVRGLRQGIALWERGVTRISPSNAKLGGENSTGTLLKFRKWETSERGLLGN